MELQTRGIFYECEKVYERKVFRKNVVILKYQCGVMKHHRILDKDHHSLMATKMCGMVTERRNGMRKQEKDIALFVAFCIEEYGAAKGMNGEQVLDLFYQVWTY